jgi:SAM-dependent methyltransferase
VLLHEDLQRQKLENRHSLVGPGELWEIKRQFQISFLQNHGLQPQHTLLDLGCGTLRGGIPLIRFLNHGNYVGVESRADVLAEGRNELLENGLDTKHPRLIAAADISQLHLGEKFDRMLAFSVLIHMTDEILRHSLCFIQEHLEPTGIFYANVNIGDPRELDQWQGFPVVFRPFRFYLEAAAASGLFAEDLGPLQDLGHEYVHGITLQLQQRMLKFTHSSHKL